MGNPIQPTPQPHGEYTIGAVTVAALPDESAYPIKRMEFLILCEANPGEARASRDLFIGILFGAFVGIITLFCSTDIATVTSSKLSLICFVVLVLGIGGSAVGAWIFNARMKIKSTPYKEFRTNLERFFGIAP